ncbi:hypothetical protein B566_EDAN010265 [Ephemera danica]|nr:hypothetical protein B566_EDAN010265 [Ephemera danica]
MQELGLFDQGEYFVVGVDVDQYDSERPEKYMRDLLKYERDPTIQRAFRNFVGIVASSPAAQLADNFTRLVNFYLEQPPFSFPNPLAYIGGLRPEAAYLYDAVQLYARALCDVLDSEGDPLNGTAIIESLQGRTYVSAMGYEARMDENGDAEGNYTLVTRQRHRRSPGDFGLYPAGIFQLGTRGELELHVTTQIEWPRGVPPVAEPACGFRGEKCISGAVLAVLLVGLVLYRNWRYEQELDSLLWKLDYRDIQLPSDDTSTTAGGLGALTTAATQNSVSPNGNATIALGAKVTRVSLSSNPEADFRYSALYTPVGIYRGRMFAVKRVNRRHVDITRSMKKELKMLRDLRHDNLNAFIGACTDPPHICIVTEYCARGSLKDIIENEDLKLDNMFVASLVGDIVRGMTFLHDSPVRSHGNLKSANCLVDSRWVLKIADFGLHELKQDPSVPVWTRHRDPDGRWTGSELTYLAPEILRKMTRRASGHHSPWLGDEDIAAIAADGLAVALVGPVTARACRRNPELEDEGLARGTQKGDVFSFAIIFYEMHARHAAYEAMGFSTHEIVSRVIAGTSPPFRPPLDALEGSFDFVRELIRDCWAENPELRPEFKSLRARLRPMRKGMKPNIFDNMMAMMEKYANNLEVLVDERTDQLVEEKKKTEALLFEMLPRSVAEQLRRGHRVQAESYDSVTIYFSDIVGFTAMSAESTPLQACPVCAGVVGLKMPRYCLFGDTVNTASRMESTGLPLRIHCSAECRELLKRLGGYELSERGMVAMKGKGERVTYWLTSEDPIMAAERRRQRRERVQRGPVTAPLLPGATPPSPQRHSNGNVHFHNDAPRSSLKKSRSPVIRSPLARASSLESPKRLRFALGSLERCSEGERVCDAGRGTCVIPAIRLPPDQQPPLSPCRTRRLASPASTSSAPSSASCPCIEALRLSPERQPLCWAPSPFSSLAASSVPLLLGSCSPGGNTPPTSSAPMRASSSDCDTGERGEPPLLLLGLAREPAAAPPSRV